MGDDLGEIWDIIFNESIILNRSYCITIKIKYNLQTNILIFFLKPMFQCWANVSPIALYCSLCLAIFGQYIKNEVKSSRHPQRFFGLARLRRSSLITHCVTTLAHQSWCIMWVWPALVWPPQASQNCHHSLIVTENWNQYSCASKLLEVKLRYIRRGPWQRA